MSWFLMLVVVILAFVALVAFFKVKGGQTATIGFPYEKAPKLFSPAERSFLGVLDQAVGPDHRVFGKVRVADVAQVKSRLTSSARQGALNRISGKHFDFLVCRNGDLGVVCAVELDDKSHGGHRAQRRDEFVDTVCQTIGLPLLRVPARSAYPLEELRGKFQAAVGAVAVPITAPAEGS